MEALEKLLSPKEVGLVLNLRRSKVHRMLFTGEIPSILVTNGRRRCARVRPSDLQKWLKARELKTSSSRITQ